MTLLGFPLTEPDICNRWSDLKCLYTGPFFFAFMKSGQGYIRANGYENNSSVHLQLDRLEREAVSST